MFGTKCPSMMSTCSNVPPPSSACFACAARLAKLADRIEGASSIMRGKVFAPGLPLGVVLNSDTQNDYTQNAAFNAHFQTDFPLPRSSRVAAFACGCFLHTIPAYTSAAEPDLSSRAVSHFQEWRHGLAYKNRDSLRAESVFFGASIRRRSKASSCPNPFPAQLPSRYRLPDVPREATLPADRVRTL